MVDKKIIGRIQKLIRDDFKKSELHKKVYDRAKIGPALFKCEQCEKIVYAGKSKVNYHEHLKVHPKLSQDKLEVDHVDPVIPYDKLYYEITMDTFIERVYCNLENLMLLCKSCHIEKTSLEQTLRAKYKSLKKQGIE